MADRLDPSRRARRPRRQRAAGPDRARSGRARARGAGAGGRRGRLRPRREVRRRQLLRPVREAGADRARRSRHARVRAVVVRRARCIAHAEEHGARITLARRRPRRTCSTISTTTLVGRDRLPRLKEIAKIVGERLTNWCIVPCPHPAWATLVYPELVRGRGVREALERARACAPARRARPVSAWDERMAVLNDSAQRASPSTASTRSSCAARARS